MPAMQSISRKLLRIAFRQLYTNFAWSYDMVAALVSMGEWKAWGRAAIQFIDKNPAHARILELAHGPGHLHLTLRQMGYHTIGIDLSPQMTAIASRRLRRAGLSNTLARANVMRLPFPDAMFDHAISTFPTEFIFAEQTLREAARVLVPGGRFIVVPTTVSRRPDLLTRAVTSWQHITRLRERERQPVREQFQRCGFSFEEHHVPTQRADVIVWVCTIQPVRHDTHGVQ